MYLYSTQTCYRELDFISHNDANKKNYNYNRPKEFSLMRMMKRDYNFFRCGFILVL